MTITAKTMMRTVMTLAWRFVKRNGFGLSEALKAAWANVKLKAAMHKGICKFYLKKVDGSVREAYGTLKESLMPATRGTGRKPSDTVQVYFDTEKQEFRCFKKANLITAAEAADFRLAEVETKKENKNIFFLCVYYSLILLLSVESAYVSAYFAGIVTSKAVLARLAIAAPCLLLLCRFFYNPHSEKK